MRLPFCLAVAVAVAVLMSGCGGGTPTSPSANVPFSTVDLRVGTGPEAVVGRGAAVNYAGWLYNSAGTDNKGSQFDSGTFSFTVGQGVIPGFSQGVQGMRVGGLRRVIIPPNLGYGAAGSPPRIPGNATLIFEIELLAVQ
jgi:FKBP-type peptidyl-prolyl cis-trans isomerase FkpA